MTKRTTMYSAGLLLSLVLSLTFCALPRSAGAETSDPESPEYWRDAQRPLAELGPAMSRRSQVE